MSAKRYVNIPEETQMMVKLNIASFRRLPKSGRGEVYSRSVAISPFHSSFRSSFFFLLMGFSNFSRRLHLEDL